MRALNFYSSNYHSQLVNRRKTCTIRLGEKNQKYAEGDIVWITVGKKYAQKKRIFTAVIDKVAVKPIHQLSPEDLQGENSNFTSIDDIINFLHKIYDRDIVATDIVTVVYFSEIIE